MTIIHIVSLAGSLTIFVVITQMVRRGILRDRYAFLWFMIGAALLVLSVFRRLIDDLAAVFNVYYAPSLLFLVFIVFLTLVALHLTTVVTAQGEKIKRLAQELALLKRRHEEDEEAKD